MWVESDDGTLYNLAALQAVYPNCSQAGVWWVEASGNWADENSHDPHLGYCRDEEECWNMIEQIRDALNADVRVFDFSFRLEQMRDHKELMEACSKNGDNGV